MKQKWKEKNLKFTQYFRGKKSENVFLKHFFVSAKEEKVTLKTCRRKKNPK